MNLMVSPIKESMKVSPSHAEKAQHILKRYFEMLT